MKPKSDCSNIKSIKDLHEQLGSWEDVHGHGSGDGKKVSCTQTGVNYDELQRAYDTYFSGYSEANIAQAMCRCCQESESVMTFDVFYACMASEGYFKSS